MFHWNIILVVKNWLTKYQQRLPDHCGKGQPLPLFTHEKKGIKALLRRLSHYYLPAKKDIAAMRTRNIFIPGSLAWWRNGLA